jgi:DNA-binding CsgD family transcriptional regulator
VTGDAGSGKSRLLSEVATRALAAGAEVLRGHAVPGGGAFRPLAEALVRVAPPELAADDRLAPFRSVLARVLPAWPAGSAPGRHVVDPVVVLGEAVLELLSVISEGRRCVVLLDDLQWADRDTLALLEYLAGGLQGSSVQILGAARGDEAQPGGLLVLARHPEVQVVRLPPLTARDVGWLARACAGAEVEAAVEEFLVAAADGLPLLVEELFAGLVEAGAVARDRERWAAVGPLRVRVPGAFAEFVGRRMRGLDPSHRGLVKAAAVLGRGLQWELLPVVTGHGTEDVAAGLQAAVEARLLVMDPDDDGAVRWRHALTQDAVLGLLSAPERAALAGRAAATLEDARELTGGPLTALVADLHARSGRPERAAELLMLHAREEADAGALASALFVLERAVVLAGDDPGLGVRISIERVRVLALGARTDEAVEIGDRDLPIAAEGDRTALAVALARACVAAERYADARRYLAMAGDPGDGRVLALAAHVAFGTGDANRAFELAEAAVAAAEEAGWPEAVCEALEVIGRGRRRSDPAGAEAAFTRAHQVAARHGLTPWRIRALSELGVRDVLGAGSGEALREAKDLAVDAGMLGTATILELQLIAVTGAMEGMVAAAERAERCAEQARRLGIAGAQAHALMWVARGAFLTGRTGEIKGLLDTAASLAPNPVHIEAERFRLRGYDAWLRGDIASAAPEMDSCIAQLRAAGTNPAPSWGEWALMRTVVDPTDPGPREELRGSDVLVQKINVAALHLADGVAAAHASQPQLAAEHIAAADALLITLPYFRHLLRAIALSAPDDFALADRRGAVWLQEALAWLSGTSEVRMIQWCHDRLRSLGGPVPRPDRDLETVPPRLRALGVTGRELQILRLLGQNLSNPEIAARLHLSRRTVETHVSHLLAKTGASGRASLPRWLSEA